MTLADEPYLRMKCITLTAIGFLLISSPAFAESTADAMKAFGMIGTWSEDCAADVAKNIRVSRITYSAPLFGPPTAKTSGGIFEIKTAERVTEEKLKITSVSDPVTYVIIYIKIENKIRIWEALKGNKMTIKEGKSVNRTLLSNGADGIQQQTYTPGGNATQFLEKCLN